MSVRPRARSTERLGAHAAVLARAHRSTAVACFPPLPLPLACALPSIRLTPFSPSSLLSPAHAHAPTPALNGTPHLAGTCAACLRSRSRSRWRSSLRQTTSSPRCRRGRRGGEQAAALRRRVLRQRSARAPRTSCACRRWRCRRSRRRLPSPRKRRRRAVRRRRALPSAQRRLMMTLLMRWRHLEDDALGVSAAVTG